MKDTITQFMWGDQPQFRLSMEQLTESTCTGMGMGAEVAPMAYLIGFASDDDARFPVCIEPEDGPFRQDELAGVLECADRLYEAHEEHSILKTHKGVQTRFQARLLDECRRQALCRVLAATPGGADRRFFVGPGIVIDHYRVYPVVGVLAGRWKEFPNLATSWRHSMRIHRSLQEAAVDNILREAARELGRQTPPYTILTDSSTDASTMLRSAADDLVQSMVVLTGQLRGSGCRDALDAVSAQPYEGRAGAGSLLFARRDHEQVHVEIAFDQNVPVRSTRAFRKVLEMSGLDLQLLCDGRDIYGMGRLRDSYDPDTEECFTATIVGRGSWELSHAETPLLRVDNGQAELPRERLSRDKFVDTVDRLFPDGRADALWDMADACSHQAHGTILVVHPNAAVEGQRLVPQALRITPTGMQGRALTAMTSIDGAVLVSPDALCHAVGVILDGVATGTGDSARGARYNSAVRYLAGAGRGSLVIIVSEDGMIDVMPDLRRRVKRDEVHTAVTRLVAAATGDIDFEEFFRRDREVEALEFYLDQQQCDAVNTAKQTVEDRRGGTQGSFSPRKPNPDMDDSYFA